MGCSARLYTGPCQLERPVEGRQRRAPEHEPRAGCPGHLQAVPQQAEAGDVGGPRQAVRDESLRGRAVQRAHLVDRSGEVRRSGPALAPATDEEPRPEALGQDEDVAGPGAALSQQPIRVRRTDDRQPVLRLGIADRVPASEGPAGLADLRRRPVEDRRHRVPRQLLGERRDRQGEEDAAAHREHIAQRVRGRDLAERSGIVDQRRKEVERADDRELVTDPVRGRVVGSFQTRDQLRGLGSAGAQAAQRIGQQVRAELRRASAAVGQLRQADRGEAGSVERRHEAMIGGLTEAPVRARFASLRRRQPCRRPGAAELIGRAPAASGPTVFGADGCVSARRRRAPQRAPRTAVSEERRRQRGDGAPRRGSRWVYHRCRGVEGSRWVPRSSKPVTLRSARRGGFDSHALPPPCLPGDTPMGFEGD